MSDLTITVTAELTFDPGRKKNTLAMGFADCYAHVKDSETGEEFGEVGGTMGGSYELRDTATGKTWTIRPQEFWRALREALDGGEGDSNAA